MILLLTMIPVAVVAFIAGAFFADLEARAYMRRYHFCPTCERFEEGALR